MTFATTLNEFCESLGCTNKELATRCGISDSAISRYRKGERTPDRDGDSIRRLASGIASLYEETAAEPLSAEDIRRTLENSIVEERQKGIDLCSRTNDLLALLNIRNAEFAAALGIDPSYISRIRSRQRIPADQKAFARKCAQFSAVKCTTSGQTEKVAQLIGEKRLTARNLAAKLEKWLTS